MTNEEIHAQQEMLKSHTLLVELRHSIVEIKALHSGLISGYQLERLEILWQVLWADEITAEKPAIPRSQRGDNLKIATGDGTLWKYENFLIPATRERNV